MMLILSVLYHDCRRIMTVSESVTFIRAEIFGKLPTLSDRFTPKIKLLINYEICICRKFAFNLFEPVLRIKSYGIGYVMGVV